MIARARAYVPAIVALGLGAALLVPGHRMGIGVVIASALLFGCVMVSPGVTLTPLRGFGFAVGLVLAIPAAVRDAAWIVIPALGMSVVVVAIALREARTLGEMVHASVVPLRLISGARVVWAELKGRIRPRVYDRARPFVRGLAMGVLLLIVFGTLFVSADRAFARYAEEILVPQVDFALLPIRVLTAIVALSLSGALMRPAEEVALPMERWYPRTRSAVFPPPTPPVPLHRPVIEWVTPLVLLNLLFSAFVAVQFAVLFGGRRHVLETAGLTYAEYARSGFFQLLIVAALTALVVGIARRLIAPRSPSEGRLLEALLSGLCLLTVVVLASALYRLQLYEDVFGFTRARFLGRIAMFWIGAVLVLMLLRGWRPTFSRALAPVVLGLTVAFMLRVVVVNPDAHIARGNIERFEETGRIDVPYLATLSADAVPELLRLPEPYRSCALPDVSRGPEPWAASNLARARARSMLQGLRASRKQICWTLGT